MNLNADLLVFTLYKIQNRLVRYLFREHCSSIEALAIFICTYNCHPQRLLEYVLGFITAPSLLQRHPYIG